MTGPVSEERIDEVLEIGALRDRADDRVGGFSHGMKQRLGIARRCCTVPSSSCSTSPRAASTRAA